MGEIKELLSSFLIQTIRNNDHYSIINTYSLDDNFIQLWHSYNIDILRDKDVCLERYMTFTKDFLVAQIVKNLSAMQETWALSLGQEDLLEKGMATHSSILFWRFPWTEESGGLQSMGSQRVGYDFLRVTNKLQR